MVTYTGFLLALKEGKYAVLLNLEKSAVEGRGWALTGVGLPQLTAIAWLWVSAWPK